MQFISFIVLVVLLGEFVYEFFALGLHPSYTPVVGDLSSVLGTVMFAYTYVVTIPSWCNEKKPSVSINKSIWGSSTVSTAAYIVFGLLGAWAFPNMVDSNLLDVISDVSQYLHCVFVLKQNRILEQAYLPNIVCMLSLLV